MRIAIIGRTEILFQVTKYLMTCGHEIVLIVTAREAPEYKKTVTDFRKLASELGAAFICTSKVSDQLEQIKKIPHLDIGVSMNYVQVIPQSVIDCFRLGILNAHGGDLPRYRGNACQAWAILNGEKTIGLCVHKMIGDELDTGDIVSRERLSIHINTKISEVWDWMSERTPILFAEALNHLLANPRYILERQSRNTSDALRCYPRLPEDGRIHWERDALSILRLINASNKPFAGAYCELDDKKIIVWDAVLAAEENFLATPGQVALIKDNFVEITCGTGKLRLLQVEYNGRVGSPVEFIRSHRQRLR